MPSLSKFIIFDDSSEYNHKVHLAGITHTSMHTRTRKSYMHSNCSRISAAMIYKWKIYWLFEMQLSQYILHFLNGSFSYSNEIFRYWTTSWICWNFSSSCFALCSSYLLNLNLVTHILSQVKEKVRPGCSQELLKVAVSSMSSVAKILTVMSSTPKLHAAL